MDLGAVGSGFAVAFTPENLLFVLIGVTLGTVIGVLPGLGPSATIALLLPVTYTMEPASAIILLAGIYYGAMYGGTITSVLLSLPGETASVVTVLDGHQMARQGKAGLALGIAAIGSFIGGTVAIVGLTLLSSWLADAAIAFGPPEYTVLVAAGVLLVAYLGSGSVLKSLTMAAVGLALATVGQDLVSGTARFTFGTPELLSGIDIVPLAMGLFGLGEILYRISNPEDGGEVTTTRVRRIWPTRVDWRQARGAVIRGSGIGFILGLLPGGSGALGSMASYAVEKKRAKQPERFGRGAIEGVAGPETANNASVTAAFIPLLTLGIPSTGALALIYGALLLQGVTPGPLLIDENPNVFWGVVASMYIGNVILLVLNIPLVGIFIQLLRVRFSVLAPIILVTTSVGVFTVNNSMFDVWLLLCFGVLGYLLKKGGFEPAPLVLAFILGSILETSFRQSLRMSGGDLRIFIEQPLCVAILALIAVIIGFSLAARFKRDRSANAPQPVGADDHERE